MNLATNASRWKIAFWPSCIQLIYFTQRIVTEAIPSLHTQSEHSSAWSHTLGAAVIETPNPLLASCTCQSQQWQDSAQEPMSLRCHAHMWHILTNSNTYFTTLATCLQAMLKESCGIRHFVLELIIQFAYKLQHELLEDELRRDAVHQQLIHLASDCKQALGSLLSKDVIGNFLQCLSKSRPMLCGWGLGILKGLRDWRPLAWQTQVLLSLLLENHLGRAVYSHKQTLTHISTADR